MRDNANEERRSEGREMGQSGTERISGLKRNAPAMPHKYQKEERKGGRTQRKRGGKAEETGIQRTNVKKSRTEKKQTPPWLICSL